MKIRSESSIKVKEWMQAILIIILSVGSICLICNDCILVSNYHGFRFDLFSNSESVLFISSVIILAADVYFICHAINKIADDMQYFMDNPYYDWDVEEDDIFL